MRKISKIVVHVSDSPDNRDVTVNDIRQWHKERGWTDIGYHWVVRRSGAVEPGRAEATIGSHVQGHNANSIGIVWVGREHPAPEQYEALLSKVSEVVGRYGLTAEAVYGHTELNPGKTCPNLDMAALRLEVARRLGASSGGNGGGHSCITQKR